MSNSGQCRMEMRSFWWAVMWRKLIVRAWMMSWVDLLGRSKLGSDHAVPKAVGLTPYEL